MKNPSRRILLRGAAVLAAAPVAAPATVGAHPDGGLLAACGAFDDLERAYAATCGDYEIDSLEERAAEEARERIEAAQEPFLATICATAARTPAGLRAKAASLVLWDEFAVMDDPVDTNDRIRSSLLRDLIG